MYRISEKLEGKAYLAIEGLEHLLYSELKNHKQEVYDQLVCVKNTPVEPILWCSNEWQELYRIEFDSISDCAKALSSIQRNWWPYLFCQNRRGTLIQKALPYLSPKPLQFPASIEKRYPPLGAWTLLNEHTALAAGRCSSPRPNGEWNFAEDRLGPPSRAYLKLWEVFSRMGISPTTRDTCLDLGACPGGWTWVLNQLGAKTIAYDRSPLRDDLMKAPLVQFIKGNAFSVDLAAHEDLTWLFCDVICYPEKLYEFFMSKIFPSSIQYAVCTLKFQGDEHYQAIPKFLEIPGGSLVHLTHNKHELTFIFSRPQP